MDSVWPGLVVTESQISKRMGEIRHALGDNDDPRRYIETLARRGFRLICKTEIVEPVPIDAGARPVTAAAQTSNRNLIYLIPALVVIVAGFQFADRFLFNEQQAVSQAPATAVSSKNSLIDTDSSLHSSRSGWIP